MINGKLADLSVNEMGFLFLLKSKPIVRCELGGGKSQSLDST